MLRVRLPDDGKINSRFLASYYNTYEFKQQIDNHSTGSTRKSLNTKILAKISFILPPITLQNQFVDFISPLDQMVNNLSDQNKQLVEARDLLLPRLMNGSILV